LASKNALQKLRKRNAGEGTETVTPERTYSACGGGREGGGETEIVKIRRKMNHEGQQNNEERSGDHQGRS
jgi:hypothetical protein